MRFQCCLSILRRGNIATLCLNDFVLDTYFVPQSTATSSCKFHRGLHIETIAHAHNLFVCHHFPQSFVAHKCDISLLCLYSKGLAYAAPTFAHEREAF
jgi:hypothetical protein